MPDLLAAVAPGQVVGVRAGVDDPPLVAVGGAVEVVPDLVVPGALCYNLLGVDRAKITGDLPVPSGTHQVRMEFAYDGGGLGRGGAVALFIDGKQDGAGRLSATVPLIFSTDETCDLGADTASPVSDDHTPASSRFTGSIAWVQLDIGPDDHDHLITAADQWRVAMGRQ
jgi:arylsulfatase